MAFLPVGNNGPSTGFATFRIYDGSVVLGDVSASGSSTQRTVTVQAAYTWGAAGLVSEKLFDQYSAPTKSLWYHFGPQGETRQLTDASGNVADSYSYTAYGLPTATSGGDMNPYLYGGQFGYYTSQNWKLVLCGLRWYDPHIGRFLSRDPIDYGGGPNLYAYCGGDPVNMADPSGTTPSWLGGDVSMSSIDPNVYSQQTQMNNAETILGFFPPYNLATALTGRDAFGRCLSTPDRLLRGVSAVLPLLGKLRGLGGATRLATEAGCSFAAGTPIVMADGTSRAVETLHAGDYVLAKDEKTGHIEAQEVTATVHHPAATLVTVTFAGADGKTQAIVCTPEHPFFVDGKGWVEAGSLGIGTSIVTRAGPTLAVKSLDWKRSAQAKPGLAPGLTTPAFTVYNFTVDASHTFFVGTANGGAWTHNTGCWITKDAYQAVRKQSEGMLGKFLRAGEKGLVGPQGEAGIKQLNPPVGDYTHELKIGGSAARIFGKLGTWGGKAVYIFDQFSNRGLH